LRAEHEPYDVSARNPSDPHPQKRELPPARGAASGLGASVAKSKAPRAPALRDRLREVLERDRAMVDANRALANGFTDEESGTRMRLPHAQKHRALEPDEIASIDALLNGDFAATEPKSELADVGSLADDSHALTPTVSIAGPDALPVSEPAASQAAQPSSAWQAAPSWRGAKPSRANESPAFTGPLPPFVLASDLQAPAPTAEAALSVFADWIAEEVGGLDDPAPAPIVLTPELAPMLHTTTLSPSPREEAEEPRSGSEPIRTRTMARLLAGHGYKARALSIYDELLARRPDDSDLRAEADTLRRGPK
jgi:hypothetical protein